MQNQQSESIKNEVNPTGKPKIKKTKKTGKKKKIKSSAKAESSQPNLVQSAINPQRMLSAGQPQILEPIYPDQSLYKSQLASLRNSEHVNKQYQLDDIVRKTQTTVNYIKALNTTVVKPVIVQKVTTRKPIIAPVNIKTPVNFFEGQPLNQEDLIIQNFFKNTTPVAENSPEYYKEFYAYNQQYPNNNYLTQSLQYPTIQQQANNVNVLTQSARFPTQRQNISLTAPSRTLENAQPQAQKQNATINGNTKVKKVIKKKKGKKKKGTKNQEMSNSLKPTPTVNNSLQQTNPLQPQIKQEEQDDDNMPRDSIR